MQDKIEINRKDLQNIIISCISYTDNTRDKEDKARIYEDALTEIIVRTLPDRDRAAAQNILFSWLSKAKQIKAIDRIKDLDDETYTMYSLNSRPDGETYKEIVKHMADAIRKARTEEN